MARKRQRIIPKNVLAQEEFRRKYAEEPWPQELILVKSNVDSSNKIRARGTKTGLFYTLSYPFLYVDSADLDGLGDLVTQETSGKTKKKARKKSVKRPKVAEVTVNAESISRDTSSSNKHDVITSTRKTSKTGTRKRGRPRKSKRSETDGAADYGKTGGVSAGSSK